MNKTLCILKKVAPYLLIFAFSCFGAWLVFYRGINIGDDYYYHLPSILDKYESAISGNGIDAISPEIGSGLGYGATLFYSPLSHFTVVILGLVFSVFGISLMSSYKIVMLLSVFLSGVFMYNFAMKFTSGKRVASILSSACLVIYPYRLFNMFCRLAIAEAFAFTFVPLFLCGIYELVHMKREKISLFPILKVVFGASLLFLSHNLTAIFVFIVGFLLLLLYSYKLIPLFKSPRFIIYCGASVLVIIGACSIALFSQIELLGTELYAISDSATMRTDVSHVISHVGKEWFYSGFLNVGFLSGLGYSNSFLYTGIIVFILACLVFVALDTILAKIKMLSFAHYLISGATLLGIITLVSFRLEAFLAAFIFMGLYVCISIGQKSSSTQSPAIYKRPLFWFCTIGILLVLAIMASVEFWEGAPDFLLLIQFPWRLWSLVQIFVSILVGLVASHYEGKRLPLCLLSIFVSLLMLLNMPLLEKRSEGDDEWQSELSSSYLDNISALGHHKEYAPVIFTQNDYTPRDGSLYYAVKRVLYNKAENNLDPVLLDGSGAITVNANTAPCFELEIELDDSATVQLPLLYYPGYKIYIENENGEKSTLDALCVDGLVAFELGAGKYTATTNYVGTPLRITSYVLTITCSLVALGALGYAICTETRLKNLLKRKKANA